MKKKKYFFSSTFSTFAFSLVFSTSTNIAFQTILQENAPTVSADSVKIGTTKTFIVSAYYSPLPNQEEYVWGSYEAEIQMNGEGKRSSDFTKVYPGMIAAPSTYPYGTKIKIPGFGIGTVHDRGGRIYEWENADRIDIWMGYGDDGRKRAMEWGIKTVTGTIMPSNTPEKVQFRVMSQASQIRPATKNTTKQNTKNTPQTLYIGTKGEAVRNLQQFLIRQNLLHTEATGYFGKQTQEAVYQFQRKHNIVTSRTEKGAGVFGPTTRKYAEAVWTQTLPQSVSNTLAQSNNTPIILRTISDDDTPYNPDYAVIKPNLQFGDSGEAVKRLQLVLKGMQYYKGEINGIYNTATVDAVYEYQIKNNIVKSKTQVGAGRFGPQTYSKMVNTLLQKRQELHKTEHTTLITQNNDFITEEQLAMRQKEIHIAKFNVEFGEKSEAVRELQNELIARGFLSKGLNTGFYGNKTKAAILAYKKFIS